MEITLNKKLVGELRTPDGPVKVECQWHVDPVLLPSDYGDSGVVEATEVDGVYSLRGRIIDGVNARWVGCTFTAIFDGFKIQMRVFNDCTVTSNGAPLEEL